MAGYNDPIKRGVRKAKSQRRAGVGAICAGCGETRPEKLVRRSRPKLCGDCYALKKGKKPTEGHHIAAEANADTTVELSINDHRLLSDAQYEWPPHVFRNPDGSPLLAAAGFLYGVADFIQHLIVNGLRHVAEFLQQLDTWLRESNGTLWWKGGPFEGWKPA